MAQQYKVEANLDSVPSTGFYEIPVNAALSSYANSDLSDVRLSCDSGYIAYIIRTSAPHQKQTSYASTLKIENTTNETKYSTVILSQYSDRLVTGISLSLDNTAVERYAQISGSNDDAHWYIINDHILLQSAPGNDKGTYSQYVDFPGSRYTYFKLKIDNAHTDPLHITSAKAFYQADTDTAQSDVLTNPPPAILQKDSNDHRSYITVKNRVPYLTSEITVSATGAKFYEREATVYAMSSATDTNNLQLPLANVVLSSSHPTIIHIPQQKILTLLLKIENKDNKPLTITNVATGQRMQYLVSWLQAGQHYKILTGNPESARPEYDLEQFRDSIPATLPQITYGTFTTRLNSVSPPSKKTATYWLWIIIILSVAILSMLTYRLMKDVKRE